MQRVVFKRPDGVLLAGMGILLIAAAFLGVIAVVFAGAARDPVTLVLLILGFIGVCALGYGFINAWRTPMLTVRPDALGVPTFFGSRTIPVAPGHPVGELLGSQDVGGLRKGAALADNKFVHIYTLDRTGTLIELISLHRNTPILADIRHALQDVSGLTIETLAPDSRAKRLRPDIRHWEIRG